LFLQAKPGHQLLRQHRSQAAAAVCAKEPPGASSQDSHQASLLDSLTAAGPGQDGQMWLQNEQQLQLPQHQRLHQQLAQMQELELGLVHSLQQYNRQDQQPLQQPEQLPRVLVYDAAAAALSQQLKCAGSWQQVQELVQGYGRQQQQGHKQQQSQTFDQALKMLNPQHLSCLLSTLARLQPTAWSTASTAAASRRTLTSRQQQQLLLQQFTELGHAAFSEVLQQLPALQPREASNVLWAACKLQHPPAAPQLKQLLAHMAQPALLARSNAQDVSMALYAAAVLGVQVAEQQLEALLAVAAANIDSAAPQALANMLWAVATLQYRPREQWLSMVEDRCCDLLQQQASHQQIGSAFSAAFTCKGLHQLLWSMAKLQWMPEQRFLSLFWSVSQAELPHMTPHGTTGILWAAASLEVMPPEAWLHTWLSAMQQQLLDGRCGDQDVSNALWAVVKLGLRPHEAWLAAAMDASGAVLAGAGSQELSLLLWSWAKLGVRPQQQWMAAWLQTMGKRMNRWADSALCCWQMWC
jgi:hypothetical protein